MKQSASAAALARELLKLDTLRARIAALPRRARDGKFTAKEVRPPAAKAAPPPDPTPPASR